MTIDKNLLNDVAPQRAQAFVALVDRYLAFEGKIAARVEEIRVEATEGIRELIAGNPLDSGAISAGFSAITSRLQQLRSKVDQAVDKLDEEWSVKADDDSLKEKEQKKISVLWSQVLNAKRDLQNRLESEAHRLEVLSGGQWARALYGLMQQEYGQPVGCPRCAGPMPVMLRFQNANEQCPHCGSVNEILPKMGTALYFGSGLHYLAQEASLAEYDAMNAAQERYQWYRHPTKADHQVYLNAAEVYWTKYYTAIASMHPAPVRTVQQSVADKMIHYTNNIWNDNADDKERQEKERLLSFAHAGDAAGFIAAAKALQMDADEARIALYEHGLMDFLNALLAVHYERKNKTPILQVTPNGITFARNADFEEWKTKKLRDLEHQLATR